MDKFENYTKNKYMYLVCENHIDLFLKLIIVRKVCQI